MFWEQYDHEPNVASLRFWMVFVGPDSLSELQRTLLPAKRDLGEAALALMDRHLADRFWLVGDDISLADICLYAYTHVAEESGFDLGVYPALGDWLGRVAAHPSHIPMTS